MVENLFDIIRDVRDREDLQIDDIPDINLYMDQLLYIFEKHFPYNEDEMMLTKTMVNNYAKGGVIDPPNKKKYSFNHIILITMTCILKRCLNLSDVKKIMDTVDHENIDKMYETYLSEKAVLNKLLEDKLLNLLNMPRNGVKDERQEKLLNVVLLAYYSNLLSETARKIIKTLPESE